MRDRIAIVDGIRTPMAPAGRGLKDVQADDLGAFAVKEVLARTGIEPGLIDELIIGNVAQPSHAANIARVIALKSGLPANMLATTVARNCASGMESITSAAARIAAGEGEIYLVGGTESMSNIPFLFKEKMKQYFVNLARAKTFFRRLRAAVAFPFSAMGPDMAIINGLTDPVSGLIMGRTAEVLAKEFHIPREEQDELAMLSHTRALAAIKTGRLAEEIIPVPVTPDYKELIETDQGPRENLTMEKLRKLKPYFDRQNGTVTVGNSCPVTDGACALLVMSEKMARDLKYTPLGYLRGYAYAGLEPERMGLGPVYATSRLLNRMKASMGDFDLIELNEAFAAQVIANEKAFPSKIFARTFLNQEYPVGELDREIMNVNGGAIALGHPVGTTGARLVLTLLKELRRRNQNTGLATLCVGGGQGAALFLEVA
jgi:acetyl-CoA acyltransferase